MPIDIEKKTNIYKNVAPIAKRKMVLFFLVDQSGSMDGTKMGAVNTAIREVIPEIRKINNANVDIHVAALLFSNGFRWMHPEPLPVEDFFWETVEADGMTDMGGAFAELAKKMGPEGFLPVASSSVAPAIFLMSDGMPTDDHIGGLAFLKNNPWFKHAIRVAVAIGNDAHIPVLEDFTGTSEAVIRTHTPEALSKMIRFVTVTSSRIGSRSQGYGTKGSSAKQEAMIQDINEYLADNPDIDQNGADDWE